MPGCNLRLDGLDESGSGGFGVKADDEANFTPPSLGSNVNRAHGAIVSSVCVKCNKSDNKTMRNAKGQRGVVATCTENAYRVSAPGLLRASRERPRGRRSAEQSDELAAFHSITSSTSAIVGGTSRPRALAVLRLRTNSYLVGACTGRSAGAAPLRIRPT